MNKLLFLVIATILSSTIQAKPVYFECHLIYTTAISIYKPDYVPSPNFNDVEIMIDAENKVGQITTWSPTDLWTENNPRSDRVIKFLPNMVVFNDMYKNSPYFHINRTDLTAVYKRFGDDFGGVFELEGQCKIVEKGSQKNKF